MSKIVEAVRPGTEPRAPAARAKLNQAETLLAALKAEIAVLALGASEDKPGAEKALVAHRGKIEAAERNAVELRAAVALAERLDREAAATSVAQMRADQFTNFTKTMAARETAMAEVLKAVETMAAAYDRYSETSLAAQIAAPAGTSIVQMTLGKNGLYGAAFGKCERLILAELFRVAPMRANGIDRFVIPFAKPTSMESTNPADYPVGIDEFRAANQAIVADIARQISELDERAMTRATMEAA